MKIEPLVRKTFEPISPDAGVTAVEDQLLKHGFLVVQSQHKFWGILTSADIVESPHKLVVDCLHEKPCADVADDVKAVIGIMKQSGNSVLPVFKENNFVGVIEQQEIAAYLLEYRRDLENGISERTAELSKVNVILAAEIKQRQQAEAALKQSEKELSIRNRIAQVFLSIPDDEMYGEVLQIILEATDSKGGVFGYLDEEGTLVCSSMPREVWEQCQVPDKTIRFPRETWGNSIWGRAILEKKSLYSNQPGKVPQGHLAINCVLVVPVIFRGEVVGHFEVANKDAGYGEPDKERLESIADFIASILSARLDREREEQARRQAEETLRESEQNYRLLVTDVPAIVYRGYADWGVEFFNDNIEELSGYPLEDFHSRRIKWSDLILAEDIGRAKEIFIEALRSTRAYVREYRIRAKNGEVRWIRERGRILCDPHGRIDQVTGLFSDISEQHNLAQEVEQLRRQQEMILTAAGEGILGLNRQGEITFANPAAAAMIGYEPGQLLGRPMHDLIHHTRADGTPNLRESCSICTSLQSGETSQVNDDFFWRQDGQGFPVEYMATPVMERGQPVGSVVVFRDITQRRRDEKALARVNDHLRRLVAETEERHRTVSLLKDMVDGLQSCHTTEEAYAAISLSAAKLFPEDFGALYLLDNSQTYFEAVAAWGASPPAEAVFAPDDCWSVRRNRLHLVTASHPELPCRHLTDSWSGDYLCVPMMVQGGAPGVLHMRLSPPRTPGRTAEDLKTQAESRLQLAVTVAEHLGLSLANLKLRETLRHQAIRDPLTGLFNRRYLEETLDRELARARRDNAPVGLIMMDLDHFKQFNDSFGHSGGDTLLRELGQLIKRHIREEDVPCRWGGEEFLLIMPGASMDIVRARAEEIRQDVKQLRVEDRGKPLGPITSPWGQPPFRSTAPPGKRSSGPRTPPSIAPNRKDGTGW